MNTDTHNSDLIGEDWWLYNLVAPIEAATGTYNFFVKSRRLQEQLALSYDCDVIDDPTEFDLYN